MKNLEVWDSLDLPWKDKAAYLTYKFLQLPQTECPLMHLFEDGMYIREMQIPADTLFIGRIHRHGHEVRLLQGSVIHITEQAKRQVDAPFRVTTAPGYQMIAYTLTPVLCRSLHPNPSGSRDVDALELDAFEPVETLRLRGEQLEQKWLA